MCFAFRGHIATSLDHTINLDEVVLRYHKSATQIMDNTSSSTSRKRNAADEMDSGKRKAAKLSEKISTEMLTIQEAEAIVIDSDPSETNTDFIAGTSSTRKRVASLIDEEAPSKAPKKAKDDSPNKQAHDDMSEANVTTAAGSSAAMSPTEKKLQKALKDIKELRAEFEEVNDDRHHWRNQAVEANEEIKELKIQLKKLSGNGKKVVTTDFSKALEDTIREEYADKIQREKDRAQKMLKNRDAKHEKVIEDRRADEKRRENALKKKMEDLKKDHKEALKEYKPEHSSTVKEKEKELKEKEVTISTLEQRIQRMKENEEVYDDEISKLKGQLSETMTLVRNSRAEVNNLDNIVKKQSKEKNQLYGRIQSLEETYSNKLELEGKRWQIQNDMAEKLKVDLNHATRANFILRQGKKVAENKNEGLQAEMKVMTEKHDELMKEAELFGGGVGVLKQAPETSLQDGGDKTSPEAFLASDGAAETGALDGGDKTTPPAMAPANDGAAEKGAQDDGDKTATPAMAVATDGAAETGPQDNGDKTAPPAMAPNTHGTAEDGMKETLVPSDKAESPIVGSGDELAAGQGGIS
jgi:hypothetical protein